MSYNELTHFNARAKPTWSMGAKSSTTREGIAEGRIYMLPKREEDHGRSHKKGDVLGIARVAGIMGAKKTPELIPLAIRS